MTLKILPKTQRDKKRYVLFEINSKKQFSFSAFEKAFKDTSIELIGTLGCAQFEITVVKDTFEKNKGIIQMTPKGVEVVKAICTIMTKIDTDSIKITTLKTSGLIHKVN